MSGWNALSTMYSVLAQHVYPMTLQDAFNILLHHLSLPTMWMLDSVQMNNIVLGIDL